MYASLRPLRFGQDAIKSLPRRAQLSGDGASLLVQSLSRSEDLWGLHSIMFTAPTSPGGPMWLHDWPGALPVAPSRADLSVALGPPQVDSDELACYTMQGPSGRNWGVQAQFGSSDQLEALTLVRLDDWEPLLKSDPQASEPLAVPAVVDSAASPTPSPYPATCASRGIVPKTGLYRAWMPHEYHDAVYYNHTHTSYNHKKEGEVMGAVGVVPIADEALVTWVWVRGER